MAIALAATQHDPDGRLYAQTARMLPVLCDLYDQIVIVLTAATEARTRTLLQTAGVCIGESDPRLEDAFRYLGRRRRQVVELALNTANAISHIQLCDFDRVLHWAEFYPDELRQTLTYLSQHDFTVLGRTPRAFGSHPRVQRDTESIINHAFCLASQQRWDVSAASRGLSRRAAQAIVAGCGDDTIGTDCSWPLFLQGAGGFDIGYLETEGLEFETLDRYADEIAALGGPAEWIAKIDNNPKQWAHRLELARIEVESAAAYGSPITASASNPRGHP